MNEKAPYVRSNNCPAKNAPDRDCRCVSDPGPQGLQPQDVSRTVLPLPASAAERLEAGPSHLFALLRAVEMHPSWFDIPISPGFAPLRI
jgi:hypothetical protein